MYEFDILRFEGEISDVLKKEIKGVKITTTYPQDTFKTPIIVFFVDVFNDTRDFGQNELKLNLSLTLKIWESNRINAVKARERIKKVLVDKGFVVTNMNEILIDYASNNFIADLTLEIYYNMLSGKYERR